MKNAELVKGMYVKQGDVDWVHTQIDFDVQQFSQMLVDYKDVFEANKGKGRMSVCKSKNDPNKLYVTLSTFKPQPKQEVPVAEHLASREDDDMPF